ncbi:MAG: hypothetical protein U1E59_11025 [Amaricoccus sp.]
MRRLLRIAVAVVALVAAVGYGRLYTVELPADETGGSNWVASDSNLALPTIELGGSWTRPRPRPQPAASAVPCPLCAQLGVAEVAFNRPDRLTYGEAAPIELVMAPASSGAKAAPFLSDDLDGPAVTREGVSYAQHMRARLTGSDLAIEPAEAQDKTVLPDRPTRWTWTVRPTAFGPDRLLTLEIAPVLEGAAAEGDTVVFRERIPVDIGLWDRVTYVAAAITPVHAAFVAVALTLLGIARWVWKATHPAKEPKPPEIRVDVRVRNEGERSDDKNG